MATLFLEPDDEITIAVGRMRDSTERSVALVLPAGSRIASSRINFRLLAREAETLGTQLAIVSPEATARALASAAGLPTFSAVSRYEAAMAGGVVAAGEERDGQGSDEATTATGSASAPPVIRTISPGVDRSPTVVSPLPEAAAPTRLPVVHGRRQLRLPDVRGRALVVALVALLVVGGGSAAGAYFLLPEARATVTPRVEPLGPLVFEVTADPDAATVDPAAGIVPAAWAETTVEAQDTFEATGVKVTETKATGSVRFSNRDIDKEQTVPKGAVVKTKSGVAFITDAAATVPKARVEQDQGGNLILVPGTKSVGVTADEAGPDGNVAAGTITVTPKGFNPNLLRVTNPEATGGGTHTEDQVVEQADYDSAVSALTDRLRQSFDDWVGAGADSPAGSLIVAASAVLDEATFDPAPDDVVGEVVDTFDLSGAADGRVLLVDPAALVSAGDGRFRSTQVPAGYTLVPPVSVTFQPLVSEDPTLPRYELTASGRAYRDLDAAALERLILGRPIDEARAALQPYGQATVTLTPDWFGVVPQLDWRVTVDVTVPAEAS
jgi:hypothetical protein